MTANATKLYTLISSDSDIRQKILHAEGMDEKVSLIVMYGESRGVVVAEEEVLQSLTAMQSGELSDDALENIVGGKGKHDQGTAGSDVIHSLGGSGIVEAGGGDDTVITGDARDLLLGEDGDDTLYSGGGDDMIRGGSGDDFIMGGDGDDIMVGGDGKDNFVFTNNHGNDTITDFRPREDMLTFIGITGPDDLEVTQTKYSTVVKFGDTTVFLSGTPMSAEEVWNCVNKE